MKLHHLLLALPGLALAAPADFNASPHYGTYINSAKGGGEVAMEELHLVSDNTEGDGRHLLTYTARVRNTGGGYHGDVAVFLNAPTADWPVEVVNLFVEMLDLEPNSAAVTSTTTLSLRCAATDVAFVKAELQAGRGAHISSKELYQFTLPVVAADANMEANCSSVANINVVGETIERRRLIFASQAGSIAELQSGRLLIENPQLFVLQYAPTESLLASVIRSSQSMRDDEGAYRSSQLFQITAVQVLGSGSVQVDGILRSTLDVLRAATFYGNQMDAYDGPVRDPWNAPVGNNLFSAAEVALRGGSITKDNCRRGDLADILGLFNLHYAINDIQITTGVTIDGEFLLRGLNLDVDVKWRDGAIKKIACRVTSRAELDLRLTAEAGSKNDDKPLFEKEVALVHAPLPPVVIPIGDVGLEFWPTLDVKAGASVDAHSRIVVPMQSAMEIGSLMTWDSSRPEGSKFQYEPVQSVTPLAISEPTIADALTVNASAWAESSIQMMMDVTYDGVPVVPLSVGPAITAHVQGDITVTPLGSPWWTLTASADLRASMRFNFLGQIQLADPGFNVFHIPNILARQSTSPPAAVNGPLDNAAGDHVRWARAVKSGFGGPAASAVARVVGTAEDVFIAMRSGLDPSVIMRVNARGDRVWSKGGLIFYPELLASTPDGGCIVAGMYFGSLVVMKIDGNGNQVWAHDYRLTDASNGSKNTSLARALVHDLGGGDFEIFIVGSHDNDLNVLKTDPFILKYDASGALVWAREYITPDAEYVADAELMANGNIIICGSQKLSPDGSQPPGPGAVDGGWLMKVDSSSGEALKTVRTDAAIGMTWKSVTVAPDGSIYTTGWIGFTVLATLPTLQVGKYDAQLNLVAMVKLGEGNSGDGEYKSSQSCPFQGLGGTAISTTGDPLHPGQILPGLPDFLPNAGSTVWDNGQHIRWTPAGIVVTGTTALAADTASHVLALSDNLSVRWMLAHDRLNSAEVIHDLTATDDGIVCVGYSGQYFDVSTHNAAADNGCGLILKLPFDGKIALHPGARGVDKFLQPIVHDSIGSQDHTLIVGPDFDYHGTTVRPNPLASTQVTTNGSGLGQYLDVAVTGWIPLELGNANTAMTYAQWAAYNQIPSAAMNDDFDGDGRTNGQEWFFGGDPFTHQYSAPFSMTRTPGGNYAFSFTKSHAAKLHLPHLDSSTDLQTWTEVTLPSLTVTPVDAYSDEISFTLPVTNEARRFYRMRSP